MEEARWRGSVDVDAVAARAAKVLLVAKDAQLILYRGD
jgi:hypothetical protein